MLCWRRTRSAALTWGMRIDASRSGADHPMSFGDILAILPQQLVFGITIGTAYGLIAIGYTMVYGVLFMINFAHGDIFMIGAYIGWALLGALFTWHVVPMNPLL